MLYVQQVNDLFQLHFLVQHCWLLKQDSFSTRLSMLLYGISSAPLCWSILHHPQYLKAHDPQHGR